MTFFRSIGAVLGTATVSLVLFGLSAPGADSAALTGVALSESARAEWAQAFRWALFVVVGFVMAGWSLAATTPARRIG
ncbi:hypothetical protein ruthe_03117 [Rubellimicrobium thermophilum DSM 16684]|uniref:Uncharacterized protein n=1 Tax=Rubellimicrobium thermophilum DSM 16684 TaxID=1123069 RepID=S9QTC9_9RHOB|nr:hypothetical protein [Rubellimicrobium thermophilum]EPX82892.1 hypothetical protein ruthe_03117 [Rubellimicrobium thermophilum DSM 16684]